MNDDSLPVSGFIVHLFSSSGLEELIRENVLCLRQSLPECRIVVMENESVPCSGKVRKDLQQLGVEWRAFSYKERGYFSRSRLLPRILEEFSKSLPDYKDVLLFIDADTLLIKADSLKEFAGRESLFWGISFFSGKFVPGIFAMKGLLVALLKNSLSSEGGSLEKVFSLAQLIHKYCPADLRDMEISGRAGNKRWTRYNWFSYPRIGVEAAYESVTFDKYPPGPLRKSVMLTVMSALRRCVFSE